MTGSPKQFLTIALQEVGIILLGENEVMTGRLFARKVGKCSLSDFRRKFVEIVKALNLTEKVDLLIELHLNASCGIRVSGPRPNFGLWSSCRKQLPALLSGSGFLRSRHD